MIFGLLGNLDKPEIGNTLKEIIPVFISKSIGFLIDSKFTSLLDIFNKKYSELQYLSTEEVILKSDILISLGGDGTLLNIARQVGNLQKPILGINLGKLGFLAEFNQKELIELISLILSGEYNLEDRMALRADISSQSGETFFALNDIVIEKNQSSRVITIESFLNDDYLLKVMADGMIVATPTGSTAYSLSSNGPIIVPDSQVSIINYICPHTLTLRPIIIPENFILRSIVSSDIGQVLITADGQTELCKKTPFEITIRRASYNVRLVKRKDISYYDLLRSKLMWGKDMRNEK